MIWQGRSSAVFLREKKVYIHPVKQSLWVWGGGGWNHKQARISVGHLYRERFGRTGGKNGSRKASSSRKRIGAIAGKRHPAGYLEGLHRERRRGNLSKLVWGGDEVQKRGLEMLLKIQSGCVWGTKKQGVSLLLVGRTIKVERKVFEPGINLEKVVVENQGKNHAAGEKNLKGGGGHFFL